MTSPRYKAFISYSHRDERWARWLQRAIEGYRVPRRLVGKNGEFGPVPRRLVPVFRDREDLSSAADLNVKVQESLTGSEALIVICSPAAAQSRWVGEEIKHFRSLGNADRIFALIVDGDPQASDPGEQCFPTALTTAEDGSVSEPLAADVRKWADGKHLARLKIIAGLLGIRLDDLRRRDMQRRFRRRLTGALAAAAILLITGALTYSTVMSRKAAQAQRASTEELLSYMLGNLQRLDPIVGLETVDREDAQVMHYLETLGFQDMDDETLAATGLAWREQGLAFQERGELPTAMEWFEKSRAAFIELHQREGRTRRAQYELGQAEFWVGYIHYDTGNFNEAQKSFTRYGAIARRLVNADPSDAEMVMELAYTLVNLGALEREFIDADIEKSLALIQSATEYNQLALVLDPDNDLYRKDLSTTFAFLADAWLERCDLGKAFEYRQEAVSLNRQLFEESSGDDSLQLEFAYALSGLAKVQRRMALTDPAIVSLTESHEVLRELAARNPDNDKYHWEAALREQWTIDLRAWVEPPENLLPLAQQVQWELDELQAQSGLAELSARVNHAHATIDLAGMARRAGEVETADSHLADALNRLEQIVRENPESRRGLSQLARASFEYWAAHGEPPGGLAEDVVSDYLGSDAPAQSCSAANLAARLSLMRGDKAAASRYTSYLLGRGFYDPEFVAFCRQHALCE